LITPSYSTIAGNSQEKEQVKEQIEAIKHLQGNIESIVKLDDKGYKDFEKLLPAKKRVTFDNKVLSFEKIDQVQNYGDLAKYGLVAPDQYNHRSGSNLVMLAIAAKSTFKGPWVTAHGLLGTNMLDVTVEDRAGYQSLFLSLTQDYKMYASNLFDASVLLTVALREPSWSLKSIIAMREAYICLVSWELNARYIYNADGNYGRGYLPEHGRKSNGMLKKHLIDGLKCYRKLNEMGFDDKTLKDTLGMAYASLNYDGVVLSSADTRDLDVLQTYSDALAATLTELKNNPNHSEEFLEKLGWEMQRRGLSTHDEILSPSNDKNYQAILKIVQADLENIEQVQSKPASIPSDSRAKEEVVLSGIPQSKIFNRNGTEDN